MSYTTCWPSAFALAEYPIRQVNTLWNKGWNANTHEDKELKQRIEQAAHWLSYAYKYQRSSLLRCTWEYLKLQAETQLPKAQVLGALLGAQVAYPLLLAATPITMVMDIAAGVAESTIRLFQGRAAEIPSILQKKMIASPVQHLTFLTVNLLVSLIFNTGAILKAQEERIPLKNMVKWMTVIPSVLAAPFYGLGQETVAHSLPEWTHPDHFLIFIDGGAENMEGKKYTDPLDNAFHNYYYGAYRTYRNTTRVEYGEEYYRERMQNRRGPQQAENAAPVAQKTPLERKEEDWQDYIKGLKVTDSTVAEKDRGIYEQFKHLIGSKQSLLKIYGNTLTKTNIDAVFKKYGRHLHPDKNPSRKEEAHKLFEALAHGRALLEDYLNGK